MGKFLISTLAIFALISCKQSNKNENVQDTEKVQYSQIVQEEYELELPNVKPEAVLILFPGFPQTAVDTKREFTILEKAKENNIAIIYSNYNRKLWLEDNEMKALAQQMEKIFTEHHLPKENVYLGGFSSGGNVALLLGDYMTELNNLNLSPQGIFIVDSPVDLAALYVTSEKNLERQFSQASVEESTFLIDLFNTQLGNPSDDLETYEKLAVFTSKTNNTNNVKHLKNTKIRMYTEPDTAWWKENRMADYEQMNAYYIKKLSEELKEQDFTNVEYIPTSDRGYRANGDRHPHSWAIVETEDLINWLLEE